MPFPGSSRIQQEEQDKPYLFRERSFLRLNKKADIPKRKDRRFPEADMNETDST